MRGMKSSWRPATSGVSQTPILCPTLSKILIYDDGAEYILSKFANGTKLKGVADMTESHANIQKDPLEEWLTGNL